MLILAIALVAGSVAGTGAALSRELLDRSFRTSDQVAAATGAPCLGILPEIQIGEEAVAPPTSRSSTCSDDRTFDPPPVMSIVGPARFSRFAETLRSIKMSADVGNLPYRCRVIGVSSCLPSEGKSTVAANLALLIATGGAKVLLIDADLRNPGLTLALAPQGQLGVADAANRPSAISEIVYRHVTRNNFEFLPARSTRLTSDSYEVLGSERMQQLVTQHTKEYQYVIIDLPPMAPIVDVRAAMNLIDGLVLVTRWGATSAAVMKRVLRTSGNLTDKLLGTVLNRVDVARLKDYEGFEQSYYYSDYYVQYENFREKQSQSRLRRLVSAQVARLRSAISRTDRQ
jgi:succinoglycan biosynthesis transport protein ExoP